MSVPLSVAELRRWMIFPLKYMALYQLIFYVDLKSFLGQRLGPLDYEKGERHEHTPLCTRQAIWYADVDSVARSQHFWERNDVGPRGARVTLKVLQQDVSCCPESNPVA